MKIYPNGTRVRIVGSTHLQYLVGMTGTVIGGPKSCSTRKWHLFGRSWIGQPVEVDGIGHTVPDPKVAEGVCDFWPRPENLVPLENTEGDTAGSWSEVRKIAGWSPALPITQEGQL